MFRSVIVRFVCLLRLHPAWSLISACRISSDCCGVVSSDVELALATRHAFHGRAAGDLLGKGSEARLRGYLTKVTADERCSPFWCASGRYDDIQDRTHSSPLPRGDAAKSPAERMSCSFRRLGARCRGSISTRPRRRRFAC